MNIVLSREFRENLINNTLLRYNDFRVAMNYKVGIKNM